MIQTSGLRKSFTSKRKRKSYSVEAVRGIDLSVPGR